MKRPMTLVASIIATVFFGIEVFATFIGLVAVADLASSVGASLPGYFYAVMVITLLFVATSLVLNILCIPTWNKSFEIYRKRRGVHISTLVFNFLSVVMVLIGTSEWTFYTVLFILAVVATIALYIVDLCLENKRMARQGYAAQPNYADYNQQGFGYAEQPQQPSNYISKAHAEYFQQPAQNAQPQYQQPAQQVPPQIAIQPTQPNGALEAKLERLNQMKVNGLITEEEFTALKKSYIKEAVDKK